MTQENGIKNQIRANGEPIIRATVNNLPPDVQLAAQKIAASFSEGINVSNDSIIKIILAVGARHILAGEDWRANSGNGKDEENENNNNNGEEVMDKKQQALL
jgi:hypothetical protein